MGSLPRLARSFERHLQSRRHRTDSTSCSGNISALGGHDLDVQSAQVDLEAAQVDLSQARLDYDLAVVTQKQHQQYYGDPNPYKDTDQAAVDAANARVQQAQQAVTNAQQGVAALG
ncbi:MAG TPA: hypothetical protein VGZ52_00010 [Acidimicrobiales bacterium]|nr:hypothetical protein [Acidimicrobiales bacterium]